MTVYFGKIKSFSIFSLYSNIKVSIILCFIFQNLLQKNKTKQNKKGNSLKDYKSNFEQLSAEKKHSDLRNI